MTIVTHLQVILLVTLSRLINIGDVIKEGNSAAGANCTAIGAIGKPEENGQK
jgi:hypothetical protein